MQLFNTPEMRYYLREDVYVEPLINGWYAWPYLVAPFTYACYMTKTHLRLMKSFVNNFELHQLGLADSTLNGGGSLVDCDERHLQGIRDLIDKFETTDRDFLELQNALVELSELLAKHPKGYSLEPLYAKVPEQLKGFVELVADVNHNPGFRLVEPLIYQSKYYRPELQSISFGILANVERRPFVLSTPRLPDDLHLHINANFADRNLDKLFSAREKPITYAEIEDIFGQYNHHGELDYKSLFTLEAPERIYELSEAGRVRFSHLGHAGLMIESDTCNILIDPVIASRGESYANEVISYSELPATIDYVLISHSHADHINLETLLQLRYKLKAIVVPKNNSGALVDPSLKLMLRKLNFPVIEVDEMEQIEFDGGYLQSIPFFGEHGDLNIRSKSGWFINIENKKIYAGADSSNLEPKVFDLIAEQIGELDIMAIGMECVGAPYTWLYGALTTEPLTFEQKESRRLNGSDAETVDRMIESFNPKQVHIYALGMEKWFSYFMGLDYADDSEQVIQSNKLLEICAARNLSARRLCGKLIQQVD